MRRNGPQLQYTLDMPRSIVWIAFAEPEMMSGWWGEARMEPRAGGEFRLELRVTDGTLAILGRLTRVTEPRLLELTAPAFGTLTVTLDEAPGGTRGSSTALGVSMDRYPLDLREVPASTAAVAARWDAHVADLVNLLHGHPVEWDGAARHRSSGW